MKRTALLILLLGIFYGCKEPLIRVSSVSKATVSVDILQPTSLKNDTIGENEILLKGEVIDINMNSPVSGAIIKVAGTDTPGNSSFSKSDGSYEILLPIVPNKNADIITLVFEVQKSEAIQHPLSELLKAEEIKLLGVNDPAKYNVAYAGIMNIGWNRRGYTLECNLPITIE